VKFTVAIDGPAAAGKGTIARAVAAEFGFAYLDTGLLYRAVGMLAQSGGEINEIDAVAAARNLSVAVLARPDLRGATAADAASKVAVLPLVRESLLNYQRVFARQDGGAVLDGRDIGTVICPDAEAKLFVTADVAERARRRHLELVEGGTQIALEQVLQDVKTRDRRDASRGIAPMKAAQDVLLLDTTKLSIDAAVTSAVTNIRKIMQGLD